MTSSTCCCHFDNFGVGAALGPAVLFAPLFDDVGAVGAAATELATLSTRAAAENDMNARFNKNPFSSVKQTL